MTPITPMSPEGVMVYMGMLVPPKNAAEAEKELRFILASVLLWARDESKKRILEGDPGDGEDTFLYGVFSSGEVLTRLANEIVKE